MCVHIHILEISGFVQPITSFLSEKDCAYSHASPEEKNMFDIIHYSVNKYGSLWKTYDHLLETSSNFAMDPGLVCAFTNLRGFSHKNCAAVCRISSKS